MCVCSWRAERPRLWRPLLCDASVTTQRSAWCGFLYALSHPRPGLFSSVGQKWAELVLDPLVKFDPRSARVSDPAERNDLRSPDSDQGTLYLVTPTTRPSDPATTSKNAGRITPSARHGPHDPGDRCVSVGHHVNSSNDQARRSRRPPSAARSVRDRPARGLQG